MMKYKIKLFDPHIDLDEEKSLLRVLKSHFWASGAGIGDVAKFENFFGKYIQAKSSIAVNNGTSALNLALSLFDLKGKEVILPSMSFVSTAHAVVTNGGIPIFADIDPSTLCVNTEEIEKLISNRTKVILPVHFGGMPCKLDEIIKICKKNNLYLIEDAAHAAGSTYNNKKIGSHGDLVCFSFHPVKNLSMPTGGLISVNSKNHKKFSKSLKELRWCGITNRKDAYYDVKSLGGNYYMNEFSAALGLTQLKKLDKLNKIRKKIAKSYYTKIDLENKMPFDENCSYHLYWIQVKNQTNFRKQMDEVGIQTGIHYKPIHTFSMYKSKTKLPFTEQAGKKIVSIPIHPNLSEIQINKIIKMVNKLS
jgi:perosamine synthetase